MGFALIVALTFLIIVTLRIKFNHQKEVSLESDTAGTLNIERSIERGNILSEHRENLNPNADEFVPKTGRIRRKSCNCTFFTNPNTLT